MYTPYLLMKIMSFIFYLLRYLGDRNGSRDHISILKRKVSKVNSETKKISLSNRRIYPKDTILNANMPGK